MCSSLFFYPQGCKKNTKKKYSTIVTHKKYPLPYY